MDKSFSLNQGNNSLSNISDLNLDDLGHYSDPLATNTASNAYIGKVGKDGQILLGQKEQSDLDRLYHSLNLQESSDNSLNTSSTQSTSRDTFNSTPNTSFNISNAKNAPATADVNFPKSVSDAYRNVKLNNENQETRYLFVSRLPIPDEDDGQTLVSEVTAANNVSFFTFLSLAGKVNHSLVKRLAIYFFLSSSDLRPGEGYLCPTSHLYRLSSTFIQRLSTCFNS